MRVELSVKKNFGAFSYDACFITDAEITALLGPSGSGKSVTLRLLAGLIKPDSGKIIVGDRVLFDSEKNIDIKARHRKIGYLFQNYALFPTMNVCKNITLSLKGMSKREKERVADEYAELLNIKGLLKRLPEDLSGGEKQRVALARLLVTEPDIILLDEPFSALDVNLRERLREEMKSLIRDSGKTAIIVTHDNDEAYYMSSYTYLIDKGKIIEKGANEELFYHPRSERAATLLGIRNIYSARGGEIPALGIKGLNIKAERAGIRDDSFSLSEGNYKIDVEILKCIEKVESNTYCFRVRDTGVAINASFPRCAKVQGSIYLDKKDIIELSP